MQITSVVEAAQCLRAGEVLAYPTEAVWGLGCDPLNEQAFHQILTLKQRPIEKGVILLAGEMNQVEFLLHQLSPKQRQHVIQSWTSPATARATTWLLPVDTTRIPLWITGQHAQVAVRVTTHPLCVALCKAFGGFIVSTSANPASLSPARTFSEAHAYFSEQVNYLNGDLGTSQEPSRIIDANTGQIIRA